MKRASSDVLAVTPRDAVFSGGEPVVRVRTAVAQNDFPVEFTTRSDDVRKIKRGAQIMLSESGRREDCRRIKSDGSYRRFVRLSYSDVEPIGRNKPEQ